MSEKEKAITQGVSDAFDFFLSQRDMSTFSFIESATKKAVGEWLEEHSSELVAGVARAIAVQSA